MNYPANSELALTYSELYTLTNDIKNWRDIGLCIERIKFWHEAMSEVEDTETADFIMTHLMQLEADWKMHEALGKASTFQRHVSKIFMTPENNERANPEYNARIMTEAVIKNMQLFTKMKDRIETVSRNFHLG